MTTGTNPLAGRNFQDESGNPVVPGQQLGVGGGGTVYEVDGQPDAVVKIWHDDAIPEDADIKIRHMVNNPVIPELGASWRITWPGHLVTENGNIVGYVMPKKDNTLGWKPIIGYYNQSAARGTGENQGREIRIDDRVRIASNLALGFRAVHEAGYVIGDINQSNAEASRQNDVILMDCDSYGFTEPASGRVFSDNYSQDGYQAPEFQDGFIRGPEQDRFGLAVLIFFLLIGSHPYLVTGQHADDYKTYSERIKAWLFPPASGGSVSAPDHYNEAWDRLTDKQRELFLRCFDKDNEGEPRPTPEDWVEALQEMPDAPPAPARPQQQPQSQPSQQQPQQPQQQPQSRPQPQPRPRPQPQPQPAQAEEEDNFDIFLWPSALIAYGALIPLFIFSEFRPWLWLSLMLVSALFFYFPVRRLFETPITRTRWVIIAIAAFPTAWFLLGLVGAALSVWPWWLWLGAGLAAAFVFLVPARGAFSSSNVRRRYVTMGAASLVAVFILVGMGMAGFREWQDWRWQRSLNTASADAVNGGVPSAQGNAVNAGGASGGAAVPLVVPTDTPEPTPTETPIPPTDTPLPPTDTPMPTATTPPTPTPLPTATPIPPPTPIIVVAPEPDPVLTVWPGAAYPGDVITVQLSGFPPYTLVQEVSIWGVDLLGGRVVNTDPGGNAAIDGVSVPDLAEGAYDVLAIVGGAPVIGLVEVLTIPPTPTPPPYPDPALLAQRGPQPSELARAPGVPQYVSGCFVGGEPRQQHWIYLADRPSATLEGAWSPILLEFSKSIPKAELREVIPGECYYVGTITYQTDESVDRCPGSVYSTGCSISEMHSSSFQVYVTEGTLREITETPRFGN